MHPSVDDAWMGQCLFLVGLFVVEDFLFSAKQLRFDELNSVFYLRKECLKYDFLEL